MKALNHTIILLDALEWRAGYCWLCGEASLLKFRDATIGQCVCSDCAAFVRIADRVLLQAVNDGLRAPTQD